MRYRLAFLATHPIQYQAPLFRRLAAHPDIDLTVYFCSRTGVEERFDPGFGQKLKWDIPLLEGYSYKFLPNLFGDRLTWKGLINPAIIKEIRQNRYNAVIIHGWAYPTSLLALAVAQLCRSPVFFRAETNSLWYNRRGIKRRLQFSVLKQILRTAAGFLTVGTLNKAFYQEVGIHPSKLFCAPYAVDNDFFLNQAKSLKPKKAELKLKYGIPADSPIILFCGKLSPVKDPPTLLKAFDQVRQSLGCSLVWVGDGILRQDLENWVQIRNIPDCHFVGFRNQTKLPEFYALGDIFVLPSSFEPWGLVVNEAMCFSLPIVVSDRVGCGPDLVQEGRNGFIFPSGDAAALATCLERLVADASLRDRMGMESLKIIKSWDYNADVVGILKAFRSTHPATKIPR